MAPVRGGVTGVGVTGFARRECSRRSVALAKAAVTGLRSLLRFFYWTGRGAPAVTFQIQLAFEGDAITHSGDGSRSVAVMAARESARRPCPAGRSAGTKLEQHGKTGAGRRRGAAACRLIPADRQGRPTRPWLRREHCCPPPMISTLSARRHYGSFSLPRHGGTSQHTDSLQRGRRTHRAVLQGRLHLAITASV
jgi:hypothetical protein